MAYKVPDTMMAALQNEADGQLQLKKVPVPKPKKGEVLVKMVASPINPSDLSFLKGTYVTKPTYPVIPGIEGSGVVVATGGGLIANMRMGKRVACSSTPGKGGTWADYMVTSATRVIPIKKTIDFMQGAMLIVNPMTVLGFIDIVKRGGYKTIVNTAAASVLGKMLIRICHSENLTLINVVRREEQVKMLKELGADYVLNSLDENFESDYKSLTKKLKANLVFDAVAGKLSSRLLENSPRGTKLILYANLSGEDVPFSPRTIIQQEKSIEGFYLGAYTAKRSILQSLKAAKKVQKLVESELFSDVQKTYAIEDVNDAIEFYRNNMTGGKTMLKINASS